MKADDAPAVAFALPAAPSGFNRAIVLAMVLGLLTVAGGFWWMCARNEAIAFLPARAGAEWIVFPRPAEGATHQAISVAVAFRHSFAITDPPTQAVLTVCAFREGAVAINGQEVSHTPGAHRKWKLPSNVGVAGLLQPGTNVITAWVTNAVGPPALWLRLKSSHFSLGTSERWQVSLDGAEWHNARPACAAFALPAASSSHGSGRMTDRLKRMWLVGATFGALSLALVWGLNRWLGLKRLLGGTLPATISNRLIFGLLAMVLVARAALFINNVPQLPRTLGWDAADHEHYIQYIQQKHALPLADEGFEMYQPPLYYAACTLVLGLCGRSLGDADAIYYLRAVNGVVGLLHCWVVLLCLRLLFRGNVPAQAAGLLVAAFLPPSLYLPHYVGNEPLAGFLVTVAIYFCLRALRAAEAGLWIPMAIGLALGGAMLTKFSVLLALPFFPLALSQRLAVRRAHAWRDWLRSVAVMVVGCLLVCGWHYGRVWARFGKPIVGNWDPRSGQRQWWLDPGFGTSAFYTSFGRSLVSPYFSGFHSFPDGIYSTLWGDGLVSGATYRDLRPPWNYGLVNGGYWAGLGISLLLIIGAALVLAEIMHQARGEWLLIFGIVGSFSLGLIWINLVLPYYAQSRASYAFPALLPFSALVAVGGDWLRQRHRAVGSAVWVLLLVWSMTVYTSFWVCRGNPETQAAMSAALGGDFMRQNKFDEAIQQYREAVRLEPDYSVLHNNLGVALDKQGQSEEAIRQYREAVRLQPDYALARNNLGAALNKQGQSEEAIRQFQATLRLKPDYAEAHENLGVALEKRGQSEEAIRQYQEAVRWKPDYADAHNNLGAALDDQGRSDEAISHNQAALRLQPDHAEAHNNLGIALGRKGQSDEAIRHFQEAVRLKPDYAEAHNNLGIAFSQQGRIGEAIRQFQEALRLKPDFAGARRNLDAALAIQRDSSHQPGASTGP